MRVTRMARGDPSTACRTPLENGCGSADGQRSPTTLPCNEKLLFKPVWSPTSMPEDLHFGCGILPAETKVSWSPPRVPSDNALNRPPSAEVWPEPRAGIACRRVSPARQAHGDQDLVGSMGERCEHFFPKRVRGCRRELPSAVVGLLPRGRRTSW
jgi:hypothetical protein